MARETTKPEFLKRIRKTSSPKQITNTLPCNEITNTELEAKIIEQDHRFVATWSNFINRKQWEKGDPRRRAAIIALLWRFVPKLTPVTIVVSLGALLTVLLAYKANQKLDYQNMLIEVQNQLAESQRRASLNIELSAIMDEISKEVKEYKKNNEIKNEKKRFLHPITEARIIAIANSFEPYKSLNPATFNKLIDQVPSKEFFSMNMEIENPLSEMSLSPERGQLLLALNGLQRPGLEFDLGRIFLSADFEFAKLQRADLHSANLNSANLRNANLELAVLVEARLKGAKLERSNLVEAIMLSADLENADLTGANLHRAQLTRANLKKASLIGANLQWANLENANVDDTLFDMANLKGTNLRGVWIGDIVNQKDIVSMQYALISEDTPYSELAIKKGAITNKQKWVELRVKARHGLLK